MTDFQKSLDCCEQTNRHWIAVHIGEREEKSKRNFFYIEDTKKLELFDSLIVYMKKFLNFFSSKAKAETLLVTKQQILEDLLALKKILQILANDDESHNPEFIQQLSEIWHNLMDEWQLKGSFGIEKLDSFLEILQSYPVCEDQSFGYYLNEYVGKEWLPFPFMKILQEFHEEYIRNPQNSQLNRWIVLLNDLISFLGHSIELNPEN